MTGKGEHIPLMFTRGGRERILIAISWDERADKTTIIDKLRGTNQQHDLDLSCFVYNKNGEYIDFVGSMAQDSMDQSGAIYHSGDDNTGEGLGDDESISCELAMLPLDVAHILFVTEIRSAHVFNQIEDPRVRVADGTTDENMYELHMAKSDGLNKQACIMARIYKDRESPTGWMLHAIDEYPDLADVSDWGSYLTRYL